MKVIIVVLAIMLNSSGAFAQVFKITDVQTSDNREYQKTAKRFLNKEVKITFNDKSITVTPVEKNDPLILKQTNNSNIYSFTLVTGSTLEIYSITFKKTLGVISSMEMGITKRTPSYNDYTQLTGKRF